MTTIENFDQFVDMLDKREGTTIYCPKLHSKTKNYTWQIIFYVEIISIQKSIDFLEFDNILHAVIPKNSVFKYYILYGIDNIVKTNTYEITSGKNIGRKNETTLLEQGLKELFSLYTKKLKTYSLVPFTGVTIVKTIQELYNKNHTLYVYSMNLSKYKDSFNEFPVLCQRKLNGIMAILVYYNQEIFSMYTRQLKPLNDSVKHIKEEFIQYINIPNVYFTGELYIHGLPLQNIISIARTDKVNNKIEFHIVDYFIIGDNVTAMERQNKLSLYKMEYENKLKYIKFVESEIANNTSDIERLQTKYLKENYEGLVLRLVDKPYEYGIDRPVRSKYILKYKKIYEGEFPLIDYTSDKNSAIIFVCAQSNELNSVPLHNRLTFNVVPNWQIEQRKIAFNKMTTRIFEKEYYGHMVRIYYNDISNDNIPLQAKMEIFIELKLYDLLFDDTQYSRKKTNN